MDEKRERERGTGRDKRERLREKMRESERVKERGIKRDRWIREGQTGRQTECLHAMCWASCGSSL